MLKRLSPNLRLRAARASFWVILIFCIANEINLLVGEFQRYGVVLAKAQSIPNL